MCSVFFCSSRRRHTRCALVTGVQRVLFRSVMATDPYFTSDQYGNPVLSWTEQLPGSEDYLLKYAVFDPSEGSFGPAVSVTTSASTNTTAESANKVAFKSDGTIIALFGKRFNDPENRFAGAIQYSLSTNDGTNWSKSEERRVGKECCSTCNSRGAP